MLSTLVAKRFFLIPSQNFPCCNFCVLPLVFFLWKQKDLASTKEVRILFLAVPLAALATLNKLLERCVSGAVRCSEWYWCKALGISLASYFQIFLPFPCLISPELSLQIAAIT